MWLDSKIETEWIASSSDGRLAGQEPVIPVPGRDGAIGQLAQSLGDGGPARRHQLAEHRVRQAHRQMDAVGVDVSPPFGQLPEKHVEPEVDPRLVEDGHRHHREARSPDRSANQGRDHLWVAASAQRELSIEHGEAPAA